MLDFDTMLCRVGEFGLYQKFLFIVQAPFCIFVTFLLFGQLFMALYPANYWCEEHFACINIDSVATAAQRRNISFVWRDGGIFFSDPCQVNNIDDNFLRTLNTWDERRCSIDRSLDCVYDDMQEQSRQRQVPSIRRGRHITSLKAFESQPLLTLNETIKIKRNKRQYGPYSRQRDSSRIRPITTEYSTPNFEGEDVNEGHGNSWTTGKNNRLIYEQARRQGYQTNENWRGHQSSEGERRQEETYWQPQNEDRQRKPPPTRDWQNYRGSEDWQNYNQRRRGSGGVSQAETESSFQQNSYFRSGNNEDFYGSRSNYGGSNRFSYLERSDTRNTNRPNIQRTRTDVRSAFAGWPEPNCTRSRFRFFLGNNSIILGDRLQRRFKNDRSFENIERCTVRWNLSELPYESIVTEGNWWCTAEMYTTVAQIIFFLGAIVGGVLIGWIADAFGRVPALVIANILGAIGGALSAISTNIWLFFLFRFITGMAFDNCFTMMYIIVLEFSGPSYRTLVGNLSIAIFFTIGTILIPLLAWVISNWRVYALVISLPMLLGPLAYFFVPESARWLLSKGRTVEATNILRSFAKVNRRKVEEEVFVQFEEETTRLFVQTQQEADEPSLAAVLRMPRLLRTCILLIVFWSLIVMVYDGHSRNIMNLADEDLNVFWMFGIASMTEFPADILLILTLDRFGRRLVAFFSMTLSGAFSFIAAAVTPEVRTGYLVAAIISRFWANVARNLGLQYAAELLPTVIRAKGVNAMHIFGFIPSIMGPFIAVIGRASPTLSLMMLGAFGIAAGFVPLFLAETIGEDLPNTLEEGEAFGKNQSFWTFPIWSRKGENTLTDERPVEDNPIVLRNNMKDCKRGEIYRSSIISQASTEALRYLRDSGSNVPNKFRRNLTN